MANLKDLIKRALEEKQGVQTDDGHEAVAKAEKTTKKTGKSAPAKKPSTRTTGRGR